MEFITMTAISFSKSEQVYFKILELLVMTTAISS